MSAIKVEITDIDGHTKSLAGEPGQTVMELARANDVAGISGDCGGGCACATCHVYVEGDWFEVVGPADDLELDMLDMVSASVRANSRLSCQITLAEALDGLAVTVAPAS